MRGINPFAGRVWTLGLLVLVLWIAPRVNRHSVNLSILFCLVGVIVPAAAIGISEDLVIWAFSFCLGGVLIGYIIHLFRPAKD